MQTERELSSKLHAGTVTDLDARMGRMTRNHRGLLAGWWPGVKLLRNNLGKMTAITCVNAE